MDIIIRTNGLMECLYSEAIDLARLGADSGGARMTRASHVDPTPDGRQWIADLDPVGGPVLGPFTHRSEALAAEEAWIVSNRLA